MLQFQIPFSLNRKNNSVNFRNREKRKKNSSITCKFPVATMFSTKLDIFDLVPFFQELYLFLRKFVFAIFIENLELLIR